MLTGCICLAFACFHTPPVLYVGTWWHHKFGISNVALQACARDRPVQEIGLCKTQDAMY